MISPFVSPSPTPNQKTKTQRSDCCTKSFGIRGGEGSRGLISPTGLSLYVLGVLWIWTPPTCWPAVP